MDVAWSKYKTVNERMSWRSSSSGDVDFLRFAAWVLTVVEDASPFTA
jgi:hypothetical protein